MNSLMTNLKNFYHRGGISAIFENFLAMLPSTVLMPIIINNAAGITIFNISNVLLATGIGTLFFIIVTKGALPGYLGSSFAYIGVTSYICQYLKGESRETILSYILGTYIFSAALFIILGILCRIDENKTNRIIDFLVPPAIMGPVVSLIGLELSGQAVEMAELNNAVFNKNSLIALLVVALFVLFSLLKRKVFKNAAILLAVMIVGIGCIYFKYWDISPMFASPILVMPELDLVMPAFYFPFLIMIIPPTFIIFSEHIARKIMTESLKLNVENKPSDNTDLSKSVIANGGAFALSTLIRGTPLTLYAENIAVMRINSYVNIIQFIGVSILAIILSFLGWVLYLIQNCPPAITGGMSLALMGVIAVPGIKLLIDKQVNYNKISNLLLTSSVLIAGLSGVKVTILATEFKGMSLGLLVGMALNLIIHLLTLVKLNKEPFVIEDICNYAQEFDNVIRITHDNITSDFAIISFYIKKPEKENLFLEITKDYQRWKIQVQTKNNMTNEEKTQCHTEFNALPSKDGILQIEADQLNTEKKFKRIISESYENVKK